MTDKYPPSGVMFPVREKRSEKSPDFTGQVEIDETLYKAIGAALAAGDGYAKIYLAGWKRISRNGNEFLSIKASEWRERPAEGQKQERQAPRQAPKKHAAPSFDDLDDEIPF